MAFDRTVTLSAIKFLSGQSEKVCRLCLALVEDKAICIEDSVSMVRPYFAGTVTYLNIFEELSVSIDHFLPSWLCSSCESTLINTYLFRKLCEYSTKTWTGVLERLNNSLDQTDTMGSSVQAVYLLIQEKNCIRFTSRKDHSRIRKKDILLNINKTVKRRNNCVKNKKYILGTTECEDCGKKFSSTLKLSKHKVVVHKKTCNPCSHCTKVFASPMQLQDHTERSHLPKKLKCPKCDSMFSTARVLKNHDKNDHIAASCKLCFMQLPSKRALRLHLNRHDIYKCHLCEKILSNKQTYKAHLKSCGNIEDKTQKFFCDLCGKGYVRKNGIRSHLKTDHGFGKVLSCKWCGKKFDAISKMRNHAVKHTKERNFYCEHCGNKFVTQAALIYHVRLHTGERPFPCDLCDETFLSASRRMEHKRRKHFGPTKQCPICPMKFAVSTQLRKHVQRHYNPNSKLYCPDQDEAQHLAGNKIWFYSKTRYNLFSANV